MKKVKRITAVVASVIMAASLLAGCSSGSSSSSESSASSSGSASSSTGSASEASSASSVSSASSASSESTSSTDESYKVAVIVRLSDMYGAWLKQAFESNAADEYANLDITVFDNQDDAAKHLEVMQACIEQGYDYILVQGRQEDYSDTCQAAFDAGIKMIGFNSAFEWTLDVMPSVVCDEVELGGLIAADAAEKIPENGTVAIVNGPAGMYLTDQRREGMQEYLLDVRDDITLLDEQDGGFVKDTTMNKVSDWLQVYDDIDCILCASDSEAVGAVEAYNAAGKSLDDVLIYGIDGLTEACDAIKAGTMEASTLQDAVKFAEICYDMVEQDIAGEIDLRTMVGSWDEAVTSFSPELITADNVDEQYEYYVSLGLIE